MGHYKSYSYLQNYDVDQEAVFVHTKRGSLKPSFLLLLQRHLDSHQTRLFLFVLSLLFPASPAFLLRLRYSQEHVLQTLLKDAVLVAAETLLVFLLLESLLVVLLRSACRKYALLSILQLIMSGFFWLLFSAVYLLVLTIDYLALSMLHHKLMFYEAFASLGVIRDLKKFSLRQNFSEEDFNGYSIALVVFCTAVAFALFVWSKRQLLTGCTKQQLPRYQEKGSTHSEPTEKAERCGSFLSRYVSLTARACFARQLVVFGAIAVCFLIPYFNSMPQWWSPVLNQSFIVAEMVTTEWNMRVTKYQYSNARIMIPDRIVKINEQPNVILIINDSLARRHLSMQKGKDAAPFMTQLLTQPDVYDFAFSQGVTGTTDTAAPAILTGSVMVGYENATMTQSFVDLPTFSTMSKYYNYKTAIYTSSPTFFAGFNWPFLIKELNEFDKVYSQTTLQLPVVNELCADDRLLVSLFKTHLHQGKYSKKKPFFATFYFANNHVPYLTEDHFHAPPGSVWNFERYFSSIRITDQMLGDIVQSLKDFGLYDNTVLAFTADHGETPGETSIRTYAPNYEVLSVPCFLRIPEKFISKEKKAILQANQLKPVSTQDIFHTLSELLGYDEKYRKDPANAWLFQGQSLFTSVPDDRIRVGYQGPPFFPGSAFHVVLSNATHVLRLHDTGQTVILARDSHLPYITSTESNWAQATEQDKFYWRSFIAKYPVLKTTIGYNVQL